LETCTEGARVLGHEESLDMHARAPAKTGSNQVFGYLLTRFSASACLPANRPNLGEPAYEPRPSVCADEPAARQRHDVNPETSEERVGGAFRLNRKVK